MFSFLVIALLILGLAQLLGGALGSVVGLHGLSVIKRHAATSTPHLVSVERDKGLTIIRRSGLALFLGAGVTGTALWLASVSA